MKKSMTPDEIFSVSIQAKVGKKCRMQMENGNFCKCHFHNASKECFWPIFFLNLMHGFKSSILAIFQFCQNGTFEPVHEIQKNFWPKVFFWRIMKIALKKISITCPRVRQIHTFIQEKVQKGDFLKKPSRELKNYFFFMILWIPRTPGRVN